ncbi:hypothetical protein CesoFtcFv8_019424 [Champsocephalus esox]|uniref:Immunoglobulin superfamily DCC subclass member 3 n=1 Tax=Champsocephalus esox TaxID=159716 RepID=A0AAN8GL42_9TELE|nr:hypothetical protein CesoFtcFv8_019424 [Champsocephalus esox]
MGLKGWERRGVEGCIRRGRWCPWVHDVCLASELSFLLEPSDVIAVRDRPLLLDCGVTGEEPIMVTWRRNGVPFPASQRVQVLANGTLFIQSFQKRREGSDADMGEYECAAQNRYGMIVSRKAKVHLASLPKFHTHPLSMSVDDGGVARFQCQINGVPEANISWERHREALNTTDNRYTLLPMGVLQVSGVRQQDAGVFRCVATNIANTRYSHEAMLNITGGAPRTYKEPFILSGPQNLTITVHQTAILECIASGNPRPIVSWSRLDGRSIGVEGIQVLGTGNLMISDVSLQHSGVYVCAANRPGTRMRRTALGRLVVQAPPEFLQWPQSVSRPAGGSAVFTCVAQGVPEPHLIWLKNGKVLVTGTNVKLTNNNSTLALTRISSEDEAIYQCIAENTCRSPGSSPPPNVTDSIIGYVLHIRKIGEPDSLELQEAISKETFQHDVANLEPATTYSLYLKAYSPLGASQQSLSVGATTLGGVPTPPTFFTKVVNSTAVQVLWELPSKAGKAEGFRLSYRRVPHADFQGPIQLSCHINAHTISELESGAVYEVKLVAYNGNGESDGSKRLVSLAEEAKSAPSPGGGEASLGSIVIGIHIGTACIIFCVLFLLFGYRRSLFCSKGARDNWSVPRDSTGHNGVPKDEAHRPQVEPPPQVVCPAQYQVVIEQHGSGLTGTDTG